MAVTPTLDHGRNVMNRSKTLGIALVASFIVVTHSEHIIAQVVSEPGSNVVRLRVDDPRPIAKAADELGKYYRFAISYEDPMYAYSGDVQQVIGMSGKKDVKAQGDNSVRPVLVPLGGAFDVRIETAQTSNADVIAELLERLIQVQADQQSGGRFEVVESAGMLHVVPVAVRSASGQWMDQQSILAAAISVPAGRRSGLEALRTIADAVSKQSGKVVELGLAPLNLMRAEHDYPVQIGSARQVLLGVLARFGNRLTWRLLYAPDMQRYYLSVVSVPVAEPEAPKRVRQPVESQGDKGSIARPGSSAQIESGTSRERVVFPNNTSNNP
jgi:hypothetical protein